MGPAQPAYPLGNGCIIERWLHSIPPRQSASRCARASCYPANTDKKRPPATQNDRPTSERNFLCFCAGPFLTAEKGAPKFSVDGQICAMESPMATILPFIRSETAFDDSTTRSYGRRIRRRLYRVPRHRSDEPHPRDNRRADHSSRQAGRARPRAFMQGRCCRPSGKKPDSPSPSTQSNFQLCAVERVSDSVLWRGVRSERPPSAISRSGPSHFIAFSLPAFGTPLHRDG